MTGDTAYTESSVVLIQSNHFLQNTPHIFTRLKYPGILITGNYRWLLRDKSTLHLCRSDKIMLHTLIGIPQVLFCPDPFRNIPDNSLNPYHLPPGIMDRCLHYMHIFGLMMGYPVLFDILKRLIL